MPAHVAIEMTGVVTRTDRQCQQDREHAVHENSKRAAMGELS